MKRQYKLLFWITLIFLFISNSFWIYQTIDNAVGQNYYKVSCDEYYEDMLKFKQVIETKSTRKNAMDFLEKNKIEYDRFQKGTKTIISFGSFSLAYNENGELITEKEN